MQGSATNRECFETNHKSVPTPNSLLPGVVAIISLDGRATIILQTPKRQIQRAWLAQSVEHETVNLEYSFCYVHQYIVEILSSKKSRLSYTV